VRNQLSSSRFHYHAIATLFLSLKIAGVNINKLPDILPQREGKRFQPGELFDKSLRKSFAEKKFFSDGGTARLRVLIITWPFLREWTQHFHADGHTDPEEGQTWITCERRTPRVSPWIMSRMVHPFQMLAPFASIWSVRLLTRRFWDGRGRDRTRRGVIPDKWCVISL